MSHAISLQRPSIPQSNAFQLEQNQRAGDTPWYQTATKTACIVLGIIGSIVSFTALPTVSALLATGLIAMLTMGGVSCLSNSNTNPSLQHPHPYPSAPAAPWYSRIFSTAPHYHAPSYTSSMRRGNVPLGTPRPSAPRSDVPVFTPFIPPTGRGPGIFGRLGAGPRPSAPRGDVPVVNPYIPPPAGRGVVGGPGTVGVGRGHNPGAGRGVVGGPGTVGVGRGHNPGTGRGAVGSTGSVGVGGGHFPLR